MKHDQKLREEEKGTMILDVEKEYLIFIKDENL